MSADSVLLQDLHVLDSFSPAPSSANRTARPAGEARREGHREWRGAARGGHCDSEGECSDGQHSEGKAV